MTVAEWRETRQLERRVQTLKSLAHPIRLCLIAALAERPTHVGALAGQLGVPQPIVSQQLRILRMMKLVDAEWKDGLAVYRLAEPHLHQLLDCMDRCCAEASPRAARRPARPAARRKERS